LPAGNIDRRKKVCADALASAFEASGSLLQDLAQDHR